ncbi:MAG: hypothetical protein EXS52_00260 [Candidatus Staskawiczbacteria bacterium]|nr:hypothetical protein [Candidatus Staskawiczbacteria bacterium]
MLAEHQKQWDFLKGKFEAGQLPHAYIFSGQDSESLKKFTNDFTKFIKCEFPDVFIVKSQNSKSSLKDGEDKREIDIALIREAQNFLSYKSYYGGYKVVIIEDAERMNTEAQNCFLKNLEEPKGNTLIMLLSAKPEMLLPTISSRCQQIKFTGDANQQFSPEEQTILQGLLKVMPMDLAEKFLYTKNIKLDNGNFERILAVMQKYFRQVLLAKIGVAGMPTPVKDYPLPKIKKIINLIETISYNSLAYNSSPKLALEIILLEV